MQPLIDQIIFPADLERLSEALAWVRERIQTVGFFPAEGRKIELAMEEALVNIIQYAYITSRKEKIELICYQVPREKIEFVIKDKGAPFNPLLKAPHSIAPATLEEVPEGGLGILLMRQYMDEVLYQRDHPYNVLTLIKNVNKN